MFLNLIPTSDTNVDTSLTNEGRDIGGGKEDEGDGQVLDQSDIETILAAELNIGTLEQVECGRIEPAL